MSQLGGRVDAFLDEFFHLYPVSATAMGMHAVDGEWPDLTEAGRAARVAFTDRWENSEVAQPRGWRSHAGTSESIATCCDPRLRRSASTRPSCARTHGMRSATSTCWVVASSRSWLATSHRSPRGLVPWRRGWRAFGPRCREPGATWGACRAARLRACTPRWPSNSCPVSLALTEDAVAQAEAATDQPEIAELLPRLRCRFAPKRSMPSPRSDGFLADLHTRSTGEGRLGAELYAAKLRHTFRSDLTRGDDHGQARVEYESGSRRDDPDRPRDLGPVGSRRAAPRSRRGKQDAADSRTVAARHRRHRSCPSPGWRISLTTAAKSYRASSSSVESRCHHRADEPLEIDWTPPFLREFAGAMLRLAGPP